MARIGTERRIASACRAAREAGLQAGMGLAHAQALLPDLALAESRPEEDAAALARLALWCLWCAPLVAPDPPDGILIDVAGSAHLFGGEAALLHRLVARLRTGGCGVRAAIADTPGTAWALARHAPRGAARIVPPGGLVQALASLPVAALRLSDEDRAALQAFGLERVAELAALPRGALGLRLGETVLRRLDQALGLVPEPIAWSQRPEAVAVRRAFAEPVGAPETLERITCDLVEAFVPELARRGLGARRLDLAFRRVDGDLRVACIGTAAASRDPRHLAGLLCARLNAIDPGFGIEEAVLTASAVEPLAPEQAQGFAAGPQAPPPLGPLVDRLAARIGAGRVYRAQPVESRVPERSWRRASPFAPAAGLSWPAGLERPVRLFDPPEPITAFALLPDAPPAAFLWRGRCHRVVRADGPERIHGEWWREESEGGGVGPGDGAEALRDYYRVETEEGARYWLFCDAPMAESPRWWLQGAFG